MAPRESCCHLLVAARNQHLNQQISYSALTAGPYMKTRSSSSPPGSWGRQLAEAAHLGGGPLRPPQSPCATATWQPPAWDTPRAAHSPFPCLGNLRPERAMRIVQMTQHEGRGVQASRSPGQGSTPALTQDSTAGLQPSSCWGANPRVGPYPASRPETSAHRSCGVCDAFYWTSGCPSRGVQDPGAQSQALSLMSPEVRAVWSEATGGW